MWLGWLPNQGGGCAGESLYMWLVTSVFFCQPGMGTCVC